MTQITTDAAPVNLRRKQLLKAKLQELLRSSVAREELEIEYHPDPVDQIQSNSDRELALSSVDHQVRLIRDVQLALAAMEDGTYGTCEDCEQPIPGRRLDAIPWARLCVLCQSAEEAHTHGEEGLLRKAA